jgi:Predicted transcriptional regulators containing the CopG/Arc/MetJ DNA-binding domain
MGKDSVRKKPVISGTISPLHKKKIDKLVEAGEFASISDFLNQAVSEFLTKYEQTDFSSQNPLPPSQIEALRNLIREEISDMDFGKIKKN